MSATCEDEWVCLLPVRMSGCVLDVQDEKMMSAWCLMVKVEEQSDGRDNCSIPNCSEKHV